MRKLKMATILFYGNNKFSYIHPQMSSDGLNLPTVYPPPTPQMPYMENITEKNSNELNVNTIFHRGSFTYLANTTIWVK